MKLIQEPSQLAFNPECIVSNENIFGKKAKSSEEDEDILPSDQKEFADDGLFSKRIFGDIENSNYDYSCECGALKGKFYEGQTCGKCGTVVVYNGANLDKVGWISISGAKYDENYAVIDPGSGYNIIKYVAYQFLEKIIGRDNMRNIIHVPQTITIEGDLDIKAIQQIRDSSAEKKYWYVGIMGFYKNFKEILDYYIALHKIKNQHLIDFVSSKYAVFTDKILVIPAAMRPAMRTADGLKLTEINNIYISILKYSKILNSPTTTLDIIKNSMLEMIQASVFQLTQYIFDVIRGKEGLIRSQICGTRVDFSGRAIIVPGPADMPLDSIILPYRMFLELYRFEIINVLKHLKNISYHEAEEIVFRAGLKYDPEVYDIMEHMVESKDINLILNRNPTINLGSCIILKAIKVKKPENGDINHDLCLSLNVLYEEAAGADHDKRSSY